MLVKLKKRAGASPLHSAAEVLENLSKSYFSYQKAVEEERTKRTAISAWRDVNVAKIREEGQLLQMYLNGQFAERRFMIDKLFQTLDQGIESDNMELVGHSLEKILGIAQTSPLAQARTTIAALRSSDVKSIEI